MEPCGTPKGGDVGAKQWYPIITLKALLARYDIKHEVYQHGAEHIRTAC